MMPVWTQVKTLQRVCPETAPWSIEMSEPLSDTLVLVPLDSVSVTNCWMHAVTAALCFAAETMIQTRVRVKVSARAPMLT